MACDVDAVIFRPPPRRKRAGDHAGGGAARIGSHFKQDIAVMVAEREQRLRIFRFLPPRNMLRIGENRVVRVVYKLRHVVGPRVNMPR